jgi:hypothetical protein
MPPNRPVHAPVASTQGDQPPMAHPLARPVATSPTRGERDADFHPSTTTQRETRVETASDSAVDSRLRSLTRRTSIEELTRAGLTRNLKTLSERDLKEWIKEALRTVITSTTSLGDTQREQLLAATRTELTAIMIARQADDHAHADDAQELAALTAERDDLSQRLAASEASDGDGSSTSRANWPTRSPAATPSRCGSPTSRAAWPAPSPPRSPSSASCAGSSASATPTTPGC